MGIDKFYRRGAFPALSVGGIEFFGGVYPIAGKTYFVSLTGNNSNGLNWKNAFTTLAAAFAASNAYIAKSGNERFRNRIYVGGMSDAWDGFAEDITTLPAQTDVIGCGNGYSGLISIKGTHSIAVATKNTRIFNFTFLTNTASTPCFRVCDDSHGIEFHNCIFDGSLKATPTIGLQIGSIANFKVINCKFVGNPLCVTGIQMDGPVSTKGDIIGNHINAKTAGIIICHPSTTCYQMLIKDNVICKNDPVAEDQMAYGIKLMDTNNQWYIQIIHNWISAADAIYFASGYSTNRAQWMCVDNHVVEGEIGAIEDVGS